MAKGSKAEPRSGLDEIDQKIIAILRKDGRATNQELARRLGMAAATVSARIRRLEASKAMRVVAVTDFAASMETVQLPDVLLHAPLHPEKVCPVEGVAVSVTDVFSAKLVVQLVPQLIPAGLDDTVPVPLPAFVTVSACVATVLMPRVYRRRFGEPVPALVTTPVVALLTTQLFTVVADAVGLADR